MGLGDVISGDKPIQIAVGLDVKDWVIAGVTLFVIVVIAGIIIKKN